MVTFTKIFSAIILLSEASCVVWDYDDSSDYGPLKWMNHYPSCGGSQQSPIDITVDHVEEMLTDPVTFINYENKLSQQFSLYNSGYGVTVKLPAGVFKIRDGHLPSEYTLDTIHFHWSQSDSLGSEHVVNRRVHPLEIHMVHYDANKHSNLSSALNDANGLAVVAICVEIAVGNRTGSPTLLHIAEDLPKVIFDGNVTLTDSFTLAGLLPKRKEFFRYKGSLTIPTCSESVHWTIFLEPIYISAVQMDAFRHVRASNGDILQKNFRAVQPLNKRIIQHYIDGSSTATPLCTSALFFATISTALLSHWL